MALIDPAAVALGAVTTMVPLSLLIGVAGVLGLARARVDQRVADGLDRLLLEQSERLRRGATRKVLDFATSESLPALPFGLGFGRVRVVRTILAALHDGYRVRVRAFAEGARGRVIVRHVDIELRRRR